ncbi:hypothetical protein EYF80_054487 [Liparis tanakae]|uniref:Uncharacterized protein n=1 Tax=Liparis tanakae TaxID=230148 RepID=A0A4Z2F4C9_9TELE|nr:hypothetical protein EYF80_054487 [Liparis tanakae]
MYMSVRVYLVTAVCQVSLGFQNPGHRTWELGEACDSLLQPVKLHGTRRAARPSGATSHSDPDLPSGSVSRWSAYLRRVRVVVPRLCSELCPDSRTGGQREVL